MDAKTTDYFKRRVLEERPEIDPAWCQLALTQPIHRIALDSAPVEAI
jgi:hypothetical protein